jgi:NAD(P)-dependent dehydrogenase (short-subunit alcohol dehydrogenase family)
VDAIEVGSKAGPARGDEDYKGEVRAMKASEMFDLSGKVALVTGGSRGLGLDIARGLGEAGATVVVTARNEAEVELAVASLQGDGIAAFGIVHDLSRLDEMESYVNRVVASVGDVDVLVNNAAISIVNAAEDHSRADWATVMDINVNAMFFLSQQIGRRCMIPRRSGKIINISSIGGLGGTAIDTPYIVSYSTSKGAVISLTRALATEWGRHNINVNVIAPGNFPSAMTAHTLPAAHHERVMAKTPLRRVGGRDDLKGVAVFFASEASRHVTGQLIVVDGGAFTTNYSAIRAEA